MVKLIGISGYSGSGKTTLICRLVERLRRSGIRTAVIKHDAHGHYKETPGTDSSRFVESGAVRVIVSGPGLTVRLERPEHEPALSELVAGMTDADLILVEGYKAAEFPKIAVFLTNRQASVLDSLGGEILAVAAGFAYRPKQSRLPAFGLDEIDEIAERVIAYMRSGDGTFRKRDHQNN